MTTIFQPNFGLTIFNTDQPRSQQTQTVLPVAGEDLQILTDRLFFSYGLGGISNTVKDALVKDDILFLCGTSSYLLRYPLNGRAEQLSFPVGSLDLRKLVLGAGGRIFVLAAGNGIWYSDDNGSSWTQGIADTQLIHMASNEAGTITTGGNASSTGQTSIDNGIVWNPVNQNDASPNLDRRQIMEYWPDLGVFVKLSVTQRINVSVDAISWTQFDFVSSGFSDFSAMQEFNGSLYVGSVGSELAFINDTFTTFTDITANTLFNPTIPGTTYAYTAFGVSNGNLYTAQQNNVSQIYTLENSIFELVSLALENTSDGLPKTFFEFDNKLHLLHNRQISRQVA